MRILPGMSSLQRWSRHRLLLFLLFHFVLSFGMLIYLFIHILLKRFLWFTAFYWICLWIVGDMILFLRNIIRMNNCLNVFIQFSIVLFNLLLHWVWYLSIPLHFILYILLWRTLHHPNRRHQCRTWLRRRSIRILILIVSLQTFFLIFH